MPQSAEQKQSEAARKRAHYLANRARILQEAVKYRAENRELRNAYNVRWRKENTDRQRARDAAWRLANADKERARNAARQKQNPEKACAKTMRYKANRINATPSWLTEEDHHEILKFYTEAQRLNHHVDHIVPLKGKNVSGLHVPWNLQVLPPHENRSKSNHH